MTSALFSACQFREQCCSWQEAVTLACQPLEELGAITSVYAQAIIRETEQLGPWYILSPEFALPHARPEEGVISSETHLSLLCLKEAVPFPGHPDVRLIIVLAAASSTRHIEMIQKLVCWLDEGEHLQQLTSMTSQAQLHCTLKACEYLATSGIPAMGK
ncbi:PTS sugar transporter subunit IIA [Citrobacter freundii]|jgi:PTS system ascorbate-specific IIA component|uniref:PTS sugar transporter subunit IIA n=1 Tax=Citrobacter braakii TaxID=57706 RepID=UPI001E3A870C|nr:PTS sugar transporter subunit IIA [Citrobacter braakii]MCW1433115.1 PTS sugar transporter subunit IIA [Citrobacter freundii]MCD9263668.1 PTS sugar transporter subunit IIA [Citrobacter braakii]MCW1444639.1 PTS sugar transporter subunit IIA [Citrobacter freundii]MDX7346131.1 PTS sugar transporter subunit IIA [Citrobacter braakii]HCZ8659715.1 PTS sugar transporter subunit IIA [Citrobacter braakii]